MNSTSSPIDTASIEWMPLEPGVWVRPLRFDGEDRTLQLKVDPGASIALHRHTGAVHAFNVSGRRELGDGGPVAGPGAYVYEPAGNVDSWRCVGDEACVVQITMNGRVEYLDANSEIASYTDTSKLRLQYLTWCRANGQAPLALGAL